MPQTMPQVPTPPARAGFGPWLTAVAVIGLAGGELVTGAVLSASALTKLFGLGSGYLWVVSAALLIPCGMALHWLFARTLAAEREMDAGRVA